MIIDHIEKKIAEDFDEKFLLTGLMLAVAPAIADEYKRRGYDEEYGVVVQREVDKLSSAVRNRSTRWIACIACASLSH